MDKRLVIGFDWMDSRWNSSNPFATIYYMDLNNGFKLITKRPIIHIGDAQ